jgi:hypothetical protein
VREQRARTEPEEARKRQSAKKTIKEMPESKKARRRQR